MSYKVSSFFLDNMFFFLHSYDMCNYKGPQCVLEYITSLIEGILMKPEKKFPRFLIGAAAALIVIVIGAVWMGTAIPTWGSTAQEVARVLPNDEVVAEPNLTWTHGITVNAPAEEVYPWLVQIGDSRAAFYSISFIENAICMLSDACRYINADKVHPEWQTPEKGKQGIIMDYMVIQDYASGQWVLAAATNKLPMKWTWLWYVEPVDDGTSRLIVRHRNDYPADFPEKMVTAVFNAGFIMERGMILGIKARAEGSVPPPVEEPLNALIWLLVFGMGIACAVRFVRVADGYHALGVGIEAVIVLFGLTYIQPPFFWRVVLMLMVAAGVVIAFGRQQFRRLVFSRSH
jgi:hypothetical protein